jgi:hypothetical protein
VEFEELRASVWGTYRLQIDDELVATPPAWQIGKGINSAVLKTPMTRQAQTVFDLYRHMRVALDEAASCH